MNTIRKPKGKTFPDTKMDAEQTNSDDNPLILYQESK